MSKILLVDDDAAIREILGAYLFHDGFELLEASDGMMALEQAAKADLVVLDLMLPKVDGWEVARILRQDYPDLPLLMLTARSSEDDRIYGLELGADDYVIKPFSPREVVARIRALLRRSGLKNQLVFGALSIDSSSHSIKLHDKEVSLTRLEFDLLLTLAQHPGLVWSRNRLLEKVWGADFSGLERVVDARIKTLRKKLADDAEWPQFIETIHGVGYRFKDS